MKLYIIALITLCLCSGCGKNVTTPIISDISANTSSREAFNTKATILNNSPTIQIVANSKNNKIAQLTSDGRCTLLDKNTATLFNTDEKIIKIFYSEDDDILYTLSKNAITLTDTNTRKIINKIYIQNEKYHEFYIKNFSFSHNGKYILMTNKDEINLVETKNSKLIFNCKTKSPYTSAYLSNDGKLIATIDRNGLGTYGMTPDILSLTLGTAYYSYKTLSHSYDNDSITIYNSENGQIVSESILPNKSISGLTFSPDAKYIATSYTDDGFAKNDYIDILDSTNLKKLYSWKFDIPKPYKYPFKFSEDSKLIAIHTQDNNTTLIYNLSNGKLINSIITELPVHKFNFSQDNKHISMIIKDLTIGGNCATVIYNYEEHKLELAKIDQDPALDIAFLQDSSSLAVANKNGVSIIELNK